MYDTYRRHMALKITSTVAIQKTYMIHFTCLIHNTENVSSKIRGAVQAFC